MPSPRPDRPIRRAVALAVVSVALIAGCSKSSSNDDDKRPAPPAATATEVLGRLQSAGLPVGYFTDLQGVVVPPALEPAATAPKSSLLFVDTDLSNVDSGTIDLQSGGSIEYFPHAISAQGRMNSLQAADSTGEHDLVSGVVVLRLSNKLSQAQVDAFQKALATVPQ